MSDDRDFKRECFGIILLSSSREDVKKKTCAPSVTGEGERRRGVSVILSVCFVPTGKKTPGVASTAGGGSGFTQYYGPRVPIVKFTRLVWAAMTTDDITADGVLLAVSTLLACLRKPVHVEGSLSAGRQRIIDCPPAGVICNPRRRTWRSGRFFVSRAFCIRPLLQSAGLTGGCVLYARSRS